MDGFFALALTNLSSPLILCFVLGVAAALARSDLNFPEAAAKALSLSAITVPLKTACINWS